MKIINKKENISGSCFDKLRVFTKEEKIKNLIKKTKKTPFLFSVNYSAENIRSLNREL